MNRPKLEAFAWRAIHRDRKGTRADGIRTVTTYGGALGTILVEFSSLTDAQLIAEVPRAERGRATFDDAGVYRAMCAESKRLRLPKAFKTDLTKHDRALLRAHDGRPFGWILHEHGTTLLVAPAPDDPKRVKREREIASIGNGFAAGEIAPGPHFYLYDSARGFRACEAREWIDTLCHSEESEAVSHETTNA
jgi:hypothetical protein